MWADVAALLLVGSAMPASEVDRLAVLEELVRRQGEKIAALERQLEDRAAELPTAPASQPAQAMLSTSTPDAGDPEGLAVSGDLRLRQEFNWRPGAGGQRTRNTLRARLAARYALSQRVGVGARIVTGDPDDPNSTDVTISDFADDFQVGLDQVFIRAVVGDISLVAGKFPNPLVRTDLVWDSDVNPQGLGASYRAEILPGTHLTGRALYFAIDESLGGKGSSMVGGQVGMSLAPDKIWSLELAAAYYDYELASLTGADEGDVRTNRLTAGGAYLSDFDLAEGLGKITFRGLGAKWPIQATIDYVRNLGAIDGEDTAYLAEISIGSVEHGGDWQIWYGYASAEADGVFAAFAQDNIPLGTNYRYHAAGVGYAISSAMRVEALLYHYQRKREAEAGVAPIGWQDRARINLLVDF